MFTWKSIHQAPPAQWARTQFDGVRLGNCGRRKAHPWRMRRRIAEQPGKIKNAELFTRKYDINATYDLLDEREVVPDAIQATHRRLVMAELRKPGRYLLVEDTTFPSFSHRKEPIPGLGPIGDSEPGQQGFLLHSILAVRADSLPVPDASGRRPPVTILGLADQQYLIRTPRDPDTPKQAGSAATADPG